MVKIWYNTEYNNKRKILIAHFTDKTVVEIKFFFSLGFHNEIRFSISDIASYVTNSIQRNDTFVLISFILQYIIQILSGHYTMVK